MECPYSHYGSVSVPGFAETGDAGLGPTVRAFSGNSLKTGLGSWSQAGAVGVRYEF